MKTRLDRLEESVLPLVAKPGQYLAPTEPIRPGDFDSAPGRVCLLVPEPFDTGVSRPDLNTLFQEASTQARDPNGDIVVDLAFAPEPDLEALLLGQELPLFGLRARRPLFEYDLVLALPRRMLDVAVLLRMLKRGGIPNLTTARGPHDPVVLAGGPTTLNPAAMVSYVDGCLVGDPEAFLPDLFDRLRRSREGNGDHSALRFRVAGIEGVYGGQADEPVSARWMDRFPEARSNFLVPVTGTETGALVLELTRPRGAWSSTTPLLTRPMDQVLREVETAAAATGCGEFLLDGHGIGRHPELVPILEGMNQRLAGRGVHVRLAEVDPGRMEPALARELRKGHRSELVFAPVEVSSRLREAAGHPLCGDEILAAAETARRGHWAALRFRVVLGSPGETQNDRNEWLKLMQELGDRKKRGAQSARLTLELCPFVPRPHTPWEREPAVDANVFAATAAEWRKTLRRFKIRVIEGSPHAAAIEARLLRGDVGSGPSLAVVAERLGGEQPGRPGFDQELWEGVVPEGSGPPSWGGDGPAPWSAIRIVPSAEDAAPSLPETPSSAADNAEAAGDGFAVSSWQGGRRPRRGTRGLQARQAERFRLRFSKDEPLRFFSHLDITRAFDRGFRKSQLPVAVSRGKDKRPLVSFGPPLPLGMTSGAEFLDIAFQNEVPESFVSALNQSLVEGLAVVACAPIRTKPASLNSAIQIASYEVSFPDTVIHEHLNGISFDELKARLETRLSEVRSSDVLEVTRVRGDVSRTFNARPSLIRAEVVRDDGGRPALSLRLTLNRPNSVRPELLTATLLDWTHIDERLLRVHRSGLHIPGRKKDLDPLEVVASEFRWWRQPVRGGTVL